MSLGPPVFSPRVLRWLRAFLALVTLLLVLQDTIGRPFGRHVPLSVMNPTPDNPDVVRLKVPSEIPEDGQARRQITIRQGGNLLIGPYRSFGQMKEAGAGHYMFGSRILLLPMEGNPSSSYIAWIPRQVPGWIRLVTYLACGLLLLGPATVRYYRKHLVPDGRLLYLEAVRGLACLLVLTTHFTHVFYPDLATAADTALRWWEPQSLFRWLPFVPLLHAGSFAVDVFFVLSGFVLYLPILDGETGDGRIRMAMIRRPARLFGLVIVVMFISYLLNRGGWMFGANHVPRGGLTSFLRDAIHPFDTCTDYALIFWTIRIELLASWGIYIFAWLLGGGWWRWAGYGVVFVLTRKTLYVDFLLGMMLADWCRTRFMLAVSPRRAVLAILMVASGLFLGASSVEADSVRGLHQWIARNVADARGVFGVGVGTLGAFLLVTGVLWSPIVQRALSWRCFGVLGRLSYATYAIHGVLLSSVVCWFMARIHPATSEIKHSFEPDGGYYHLAVGATLLVYLLLTSVAAAALTAFIDEPCTRFAKVLAQVIGRKRRPDEHTTHPPAPINTPQPPG